MKRRYLLVMIAVVLLIAGCGDSRDSDIAHSTTTEGQDETITSRNDGFEFNSLHWQVGPDRDMTWEEAKAWVDGLGGNWRMPTRAELQGLWDEGIRYDNWGPLENSGYGIWSGEVQDSWSAWFFDFVEGGEHWFYRDDYSDNFRAFAVRSR